MFFPIYVWDQDPDVPLPLPYTTSFFQENHNKIKFILDGSTKPPVRKTLIAFRNPDSIGKGHGLYPMAIMATLTNQEEVTPNSSTYLLAIQDRYVLEEVKLVADLIGDATLWGTEDTEDGTTYGMINDVATQIVDNRSNLTISIPANVIQNLKTADSTTEKLYLLADFFLINSTDRIKFLQQSNIADQWDMIATAMLRMTSEKQKRNKIVSNHNKEKKPVVEKKTFEQEIRELPLQGKVLTHVGNELDRLKRLPTSSQEHNAVLDYLNVVKSLPWNTYTNIVPDIKELKNKLDSTHYGLTEPKRFIVEHFAMEQISQKPSGSILCFAGEPGVGKTSIAKEIAAATNRPLISIALGGVSDESELRGHRRTYLASRPGRIINGLRDAKSMSPLILFDEIDKLGHGHGDPQAALLEILDPEQNCLFTDRYLEFPIDLSSCLFICTANDLRRISTPLLDRMDVINFPTPTIADKESITRDFIIPKIINNYRLESFNITIDPLVISYLVKAFSIRQIQKRLQRIYRSAATQIFLTEAQEVVVNSQYVENLLGITINLNPRIGFT